MIIKSGEPINRDIGKYVLKTDKNGVVSCSCMSWRFQKLPIGDRCCKHLLEAVRDRAKTSWMQPF